MSEYSTNILLIVQHRTTTVVVLLIVFKHALRKPVFFFYGFKREVDKSDPKIYRINRVRLFLDFVDHLLIVPGAECDVSKYGKTGVDVVRCFFFCVVVVVFPIFFFMFFFSFMFCFSTRCTMIYIY